MICNPNHRLMPMAPLEMAVFHIAVVYGIQCRAQFHRERKMRKFHFDALKTFKAIRWMLNGADGNRASLHALCSACFFADRKVLNMLGRPIFGDSYKAREYGPVPVGICEMLNGRQEWLQSLKHFDISLFPWTRVDNDIVLDKPLKLRPEQDCSPIAPREMKIIEEEFDNSVAMPFGDRAYLSHEGDAWKNGRKRFDHLIAYEDMLECDEWET